MATPTPPPPSRPGRRGSLRLRLVLIITLIASLAVLVLAGFAFSRNGQTQDYLSARLEQAVNQQAEEQLLGKLNEEAGSVDLFFTAVNSSVTSNAAYVANLLGQKAALGKGEYWDAKQRLTLLPGGSYDNSNADPAAVFVPAGVTINASLVEELNTVIYMDLVGPAVLNSNPNIVAVYYIDTRGSTIYYPNIDLANLVPPDFAVTEQIFFTAAAPAGNPNRLSVWTPPYQDPALTGLIVTNSAPVYDRNGQFRGVVAADVQLAAITEQIKQISLGQTGYALLIDSAGRIIALPESGYEELSLTPEEVPINETPRQSVLQDGPQEILSIFQAMTQGASSVARAAIHGEDHYIGYTPIPSTGYSLAIIVPASEMNSAIIETRQTLDRERDATLYFGLALFLAVVVGAILVSFGASSVLTTPLEYLTQAAQKVGAGDLNAEAPVLSADEIGVLARTFNTMTKQMRDLVGSLEQRVAERTRDLALAAEVGRGVSQVRDLDSLLSQAVDLIRAGFELYYAQIYLTDSSGRLLILRAGTGAVGAELLRRNFRLPVGSGSINGAAAAEKRAIIVSDTATSNVFRPNPLLPSTRSEMAVPLLAGDRVVGVLDLQSSTPGTFSVENLSAFEALAGQLAVAIENAALFAQTRQTRAEAEEQTRRLTRAGWADFLNAIDRNERLAYTYEAGADTPTDAADAAAGDQPVELRALSAPIVIAGEPVGTLRLEGRGSKSWTDEEAELANAVAGRVAQQIENIRLLAQAEQYRIEAEQAARRLTREGWVSYVDSAAASGYYYNGERVSPMTPEAGVESPAIAHPVSVRGETIGELIVEGTEEGGEEAAELLEAVAAQLSTHIENLRLTEQTQAALAETQTLYETSAQLNAASSLEDILRVTAGPGIIAGADNALLFIFDPDSEGRPEWMEVRANWAREGTFALPIGIRFYVHSHPMSRLWINHPDAPVFVNDVTDDDRVDATLRAAFGQARAQAVALMPLALGGSWIGLVAIYWAGPHTFAGGDLPLYRSLATQAAVVVDNRLLFAKTHAALAESEKLYEASRSLAAANTLQDVLATVVEGVPVPAVNRAVLMAYERDPRGVFSGARVIANWHSGQGTPPTQLGRYYPAQLFQVLSVFMNAEPAFFDDAQSDPRVDAATRSVFVQQSIRGAAVLPLWVGGKQLGIVVIECEDPHHFTENEIRPYTSLAQQMAIAVENRRLFEQTQAALAEAEELYKASARLNAAASPDETLLVAAQSALSSGMTGASLYTFDLDEAGRPRGLVVVSSLDADGKPVEALLGTRSSLGDFSYSKYWLDDPYSPLAIGDAGADPRISDADRARMPGIGALIAIPLIIGLRWVGLITVSWGAPHPFGEKEIRLYRSLGAQTAAVLDNQLLLRQTQRRAERESIINLINQKIQSATTVEAAMQTAVRELGQIFKARRAVVELDTSVEPKNGK